MLLNQNHIIFFEYDKTWDELLMSLLTEKSINESEYQREEHEGRVPLVIIRLR